MNKYLRVLRGFAILFLVLLPFIIAGIGGFIIYFGLAILVVVVETVRQALGATNTIWDPPSNNGFD